MGRGEKESIIYTWKYILVLLDWWQMINLGLPEKLLDESGHEGYIQLSNLTYLLTIPVPRFIINMFFWVLTAGLSRIPRGLVLCLSDLARNVVESLTEIFSSDRLNRLYTRLIISHSRLPTSPCPKDMFISPFERV